MKFEEIQDDKGGISVRFEIDRINQLIIQEVLKQPVYEGWIKQTIPSDKFREIEKIAKRYKIEDHIPALVFIYRAIINTVNDNSIHSSKGNDAKIKDILPRLLCDPPNKITFKFSNGDTKTIEGGRLPVNFWMALSENLAQDVIKPPREPYRWIERDLNRLAELIMDGPRSNTIHFIHDSLVFCGLDSKQTDSKNMDSMTDTIRQRIKRGYIHTGQNRKK